MLIHRLFVSIYSTIVRTSSRLQNMHIPERLHFIAAVVLSTTVLGSSLAAASRPSKDPKVIMELAGEISGLNSLKAQPWHLKVSFKALGEKGYLLDQGTYEEVWISPIKFKRSLVGISHS